MGGPTMIADMQRVTSHATSRFPVEEQERRITDVRCPSCGARSLVHMPPAVVGADVQVRCTQPECGLVMTEEDWGKARTGLGGLRRFSAQLAIAAVAAGVMLLTAAIGGTQ